MINIVTIHHKLELFIDVQNKYITKNTSEEFRIWAGLFECSELKYNTKHYYSDDLLSVGISHNLRMNYLVSKVLETAEDDELIVFMDGDAFPINNWTDKVREYLTTHSLVAVQRSETSNFKPHPVFCCTTVKFWKEFCVNWKSKHNPRIIFNERLLELNWKKIRRSNNINIHPLFFGVYDFMYHHGASFRKKISKRDWIDRVTINERRKNGETGVHGNIAKFNIDQSKLVYDYLKDDMYFISDFFI